MLLVKVDINMQKNETRFLALILNKIHSKWIQDSTEDHIFLNC